MEKRYISVDVETTGRTPGKSSMLSIGACVVGDINKSFYNELKPLPNAHYSSEATKIACSGLDALNGIKNKDSRYDPQSTKFEPRMALAILQEKGKEPTRAMLEFYGWIKNVSDGFRPVMAAAPLVFDGMFLNWYFDNFFEGINAFGRSGEDINSMYRGIIKDTSAHIRNFGLRDKTKRHNALEDAIQQAIEIEEVL